MIDTEKDYIERPVVEFDDKRQREGHLLERIYEDERVRVVEAGTVIEFKNGEYIVTQGAGSDGIYIILQGLVESVCEEVPGRELTLSYWSKGEFVGAPNILSDRPHIWSSKAVGAVRTLWLPEETLRELIENSPKFAIALIHCLSFKAERYAKLAQTLAMHSIESRLAEVLLSYGRDYGDTQADSLVVGRVRQRDLAKMVGATRQSVSLALKKMQAQQLIEIKPTSIVVKRLDSLRRLIEQ
jgi:CRP-like cAMP-binding protein